MWLQLVSVVGVKTEVRLPCDECRMHVLDMEEELVEWKDDISHSTAYILITYFWVTIHRASNNVQCAAVLVEAIESGELVLIWAQKVLNDRCQDFVSLVPVLLRIQRCRFLKSRLSVRAESKRASSLCSRLTTFADLVYKLQSAVEYKSSLGLFVLFSFFLLLLSEWFRDSAWAFRADRRESEEGGAWVRKLCLSASPLSCRCLNLQLSRGSAQNSFLCIPRVFRGY